MARVGRRGRTAYWDDPIIHALVSGKLTILTGSAISKYGPTWVPTGSRAAADMKLILEDDFARKESPSDAQVRKRLKNRIQCLIRELPFESVMGLLADATSADEAEDVIHEMASTSVFNPVHEILAAWMAMAPAVEGPSLAIITTNYDLGIENAIRKSHPKLHYQHTVFKSQAPETLGFEPVLFKIHGSDAASLPYGFVLTHDQESTLEAWKNRLLHQLVDGRVLLIVGYSGLDLDILPALGKCRWSAIYSVRPLQGLRRDSPHGYASPPFVLDDKMQTLGPKADLNRALRRLSRLAIAFRPASAARSGLRSGERVSRALQSISPDQRSLWFASIMIHSGAWVLGNRALDLVGGADTPAKIAARASAFFYGGKYLANATQWRALLRNGGAHLSLRERVDAYCSAAASLNCAGALWGAWQMLARALACLVRMGASSERGVWAKCFGTVLETAVVCVPLASYLPKHDWVEGLVVNVIRRNGAFPVASIISRYSQPTGGALSLGQRAALVNELRYAGRRAVIDVEKGRCAGAPEAIRWLGWSIVWANRLDDCAGRGKAYLDLWRLYVLEGDQVNAIRSWRKGWQNIAQVEYVGWRAFFSTQFARAAERAARVTIGSTTWAGTSQDWSFRFGKIATSVLSVR